MNNHNNNVEFRAIYCERFVDETFSFRYLSQIRNRTNAIYNRIHRNRYVCMQSICKLRLINFPVTNIMHSTIPRYHKKALTWLVISFTPKTLSLCVTQKMQFYARFLETKDDVTHRLWISIQIIKRRKKKEKTNNQNNIKRINKT